MEKIEVGSVGKTLVDTGITSWQIPSGFDGGKIYYGSIGPGSLADDIISARHVQADSINTKALQAESITAEKIAAGAITADKIDADAIHADHISADAITSDKIAAGAIDASKILAGTITADKLISDLITANSGLIAVGAIGTAQIADGSITAAKIVSLNADVIEAGTISADKIILVGDGGVIYELNVAASGLQLSELSDEKYKSKINGTVLVAKSVTADQIAAKAITANEIASNTITAEQVNIANLFAAQATIDAINTMDITSNTYLRLLVGSGEIGGRNYIRNSESVLGENFSIIGTSGGGVYMDGSALVIIYGVTTSQNGEVLSIS